MTARLHDKPPSTAAATRSPAEIPADRDGLDDAVIATPMPFSVAPGAQRDGASGLQIGRK